jgi:alginate O-acetyltransferase complex protein AlgI
MTFTTLTFLLFLAAVFSLYWVLRHRQAQNLLLVVASYFFYGWWDWRFCGLMLAASLLDFGVGLGLNRVETPRKRRVVLAVGLTGNLVTLGFFKYFNFFADNFRVAAQAIGWQVDPLTLQVVLPVGISFYTFQTMSYSIDVYRGRLRGTTHWIEYLAYVSFFPQLVAGPIERATRLLPQFFQARRFDYAQAVDGCRQALWGFFKKMVIADNLAPMVDAAFGQSASFNGAEMASATVLFAFQIYCDFSGYSDIAVGVARLFGFDLMRNFACPYFSQSLSEFWRRWHISLTTWFKDYVYFPLGGNRGSKSRTTVNILVTFVLSGFWHGAAWHYVVWGALNGAAILPENLSSKRQTRHVAEVPGGEKAWPGFKRLGRMLFTFGVVCLGWLFFRSKSLGEALDILQRLPASLVRLDGPIDFLAFAISGRLGEGLVLVLAVLVGAEWWQRRHPHPLQVKRWPAAARWGLYVVMTWTILCFGTFEAHPFIYFQF